jgi:hypothetical protein
MSVAFDHPYFPLQTGIERRRFREVDLRGKPEPIMAAVICGIPELEATPESFLLHSRSLHDANYVLSPFDCVSRRFSGLVARLRR